MGLTVCLQNVLLKFEEKKSKIPPNTPKIGNGLILLIRVRKSIGLKWLNNGHFPISSIFINSKIKDTYVHRDQKFE